MRFSSFLTALFLLPLLLLLSCAADPASDLTNLTTNATPVDVQTEIEAEADDTPLHLTLALEYEGVEEVAENTGPEIDRFLTGAGLQPGMNYCAAFVSYILDQAEPEEPTVRSGVAQHFITDRSIEAKQVLRGTISVPEGDLAVWKRGSTWQGHIGILTDEWQGAEGRTIEANTSPGPRASPGTSHGVHRRDRMIQPGNYFRITHFTPVRYS